MKQLRVSILALLAVAVLALGAPRSAEAVILAPGATTPSDLTAFPGGTELDSVFYDDVVAISGAGVVRYTVDLAAAVYRSLTGTIDIYYQVKLEAGPDDIARLSVNDFAGWITDVFSLVDGSSVACTACPGGSFVDGTEDALTYDRDAAGAVIGFNFEPPPLGTLNPGETTLVFLVRTTATHYTRGAMSVINGATIDRAAFQPTVPEPGSLALLGLGFLFTGAVARRRKKAAN